MVFAPNRREGLKNEDAADVALSFLFTCGDDEFLKGVERDSF